MSARPLMLGIAGDNGAGKTTLTRGIVRILGDHGVTPISLDDYFRYDRAERARRGLTVHDPAASDLALMTEHVAALRAGGSVTKPVYDHRTGTFRGPELVAATGLVIVYGIHTLATPELAALFDLTVYLDPDAGLRRQWQLQRDVALRGYTAAQVKALRQANERDAALFVDHQRCLSDIVVRFFPPPATPAAAALSGAHLGVEVRQRLAAGRTPLAAAVAAILGGEPSTSDGVTLRLGEVDADGLPVEILTLEPHGRPWFDHPLVDSLGELLSDGTAARSPNLALVQLLIARQLVQAGSSAG